LSTETQWVGGVMMTPPPAFFCSSHWWNLNSVAFSPAYRLLWWRQTVWRATREKKVLLPFFQKNTFCFVFRDRRDNGVRSTSKIEKRRDRAQAEKERGSSFIWMCARLAIFFAAGEIFVASSWQQPNRLGPVFFWLFFP
jgi:hypothetical protein